MTVYYMLGSMSRPRKTKRDTTAALRVVLYTRVSTREQEDSGAGLAAQESALRAEAERRGWDVVALLTDAGCSGAKLSKRPALAEALTLLTGGKADALAVSKLDRLSRSTLDSAGLLVRAEREGWDLVALDINVDTTTPSGRLISNIMAATAEWERSVISQRTSDGLRAKQSAGVRLGRPQTLPEAVVTRIVTERAAGRSLAAIGASLDADEVPTAQGGQRWYPATVSAVLRSQAGQAVA